jgi:S1-C subfamily serine protease
MDEDEKWGEEIDYNVFTASHRDRLLYAANGCDLHSIVADPGFTDPGSGDFSIDPGGEVFELGFRNFDMHSFGVLSPGLRSIAKSPEIPGIQMSTNVSEANMQGSEVTLWMDALLIEPEGNALSAYGVSLDASGVALVQVPEFSEASAKGFRKGDFIIEVDGKRIDTMETFISLMSTSGKHRVLLVRNQEEMDLIFKN